MNRRAKIVATIGPSVSDIESIRKLLLAGMNVARLNFSHGSYADHEQVYKRLRQASAELHRPVSILQDLQGPKIRTGKIPGEGKEITAGERLVLTTRPEPGEPDTVPVDFPELVESAQVGKHILLDDGNLELEVLSVDEDSVETRVVLGGLLKSHKGINFPGADITIPGFTEKDQADLDFGLSLGIDMVAVSFVRSAKDIERVRQAIQAHPSGRPRTPIIAKLERPEAIENLEEILQAADGVMVARGDLGVEMQPETVPIAQKEIIQAANRMGRSVITATQMLDSMIRSPRPTRAEVSDVANAILDGSDAVMLSGETATGRYPIQAVQMMEAIICEAEQHMFEWGHFEETPNHPVSSDDAYFMTQAARALAHDTNVAAVAVFTTSGRTALMMSKTRPQVPILAFTDDERTYHRMNLYWGVTPQLVPHVETLEAMMQAVDAMLIAATNIAPDQQVVLLCGYPIHQVGATNLLLLHTVGS